MKQAVTTIWKKRDSLFSVTNNDGSVNFLQLIENARSWCNDGVDLNHIIKQLTVEQIKLFLPMISIKVVFQKKESYYWAFRGLSVEKASILAEFLANRATLSPRPYKKGHILPESIDNGATLSTPGQLGEMLREQPKEVTKVIIENFKAKLPSILGTLGDIQEAASYIIEPTFFYEEVLWILDLSTILVTDQHIRSLVHLGETIAMQIAKQANAIFKRNYISMHNFMSIVAKPYNTEYYNLMYLAMLQALSKVFYYAIIEQDETKTIEREVFYFVVYLKNASQEVQNIVWSALKEYLPTIIIKPEERRSLIRHFETNPDLYRHFFSIFPESFDKDDLVRFEATEIPRVSLIIGLATYKKERDKNSNNYYYFGIFKYLGARSKQEEFDAIDTLIQAILDPDNSSLEAGHITVLSQGGPLKVMAHWSGTYGLDYNCFLKQFEKDAIVNTM